MNAVDTMQAKYDELSEAAKKQAEFLNQIVLSIKQLRAERKRALAQINETSGALQAYGSSLQLLKGKDAPVETPAVATETSALEGEVVT
jgi:hypothetical protein